MFWLPSASRNPAEAPRLTTNSDVSIEPMTLRGAILPEASSVGVPTGPHPPPPIASMNPATAARGTRNAAGTRPWNEGRRPPMLRNRHTTYTPSSRRMVDMTGAAASPETVSRFAPKNAAIPPGTAMKPTTRQSMLPKRQCENPDASVVPTSARCTVADTDAGVSPAASSRVEDVTP